MPTHPVLALDYALDALRERHFEKAINEIELVKRYGNESLRRQALGSENMARWHGVPPAETSAFGR
jgi:hypothetical protein